MGRLKMVGALVLSGALLAGISAVALPVQAQTTSHPGKPGHGQVLSGTIASVSAGTITLNLSAGGTATVNTNPKTVYIANGQKAPGPPATGTRVMVQVQKQADGSLLARAVLSGTLPAGAGKGANGASVTGAIAGFTTSTITVTTSSGVVNVAFNAKTRFLVNGVAGTAAGLRNGQQVHIQAQKQADGSLLARVVIIGALPQKPAPPANAVHATGTVASYSAAGITVTTSKGAVSFSFDTSTRFFINGAKSTTPPAGLTGQVTVMGVKQSNGTNLAKTVAQGKKPHK